MKKTTTLFSIALITFSASCRKAETPVPTTAIAESAAQYKKASGGTTTSSRTFGGQATAVDAMVWNTQTMVVTSTQTILAQTVALAATGGSDVKTQLQASIPGTLAADSLHAFTVGQADSSHAKSSVTNLNLTVGAHTISASFLQSAATVKCRPVRTGGSQITGLVLNGSTVTVTGAPNQSIYLANGGMMIINEQSTSTQSGSAVITVTALHIILPNKADIKLASSRAQIKC